MSISYQSKDSAVHGLQLKVQELCVKLADSQVVSVSGLDVTIDVKEAVGEVRSAIHCDDSIGLSLIAQAGIAVSGSQVTLSLSNALAAADSIILKYVVAE